MSEKRRRWFQIHLSTAIVLMFVAGALMLKNFQTQFGKFIMLGKGSPPYTNLPPNHMIHHTTNTMTQGFPAIFREYYVVGGIQYSDWRLPGMAVDLLFVLSLACSITFALEWRIRGRVISSV